MTTANPVRVSLAEVRALVSELLVARTMPRPHADTVADVLVRTTARGFASHGIALLPMYLSWMDSGAIRAGGEPAVVTRTAAAALLDGDGAMGQLTGTVAADLAVEMVGTSGVALVATRNSNHIGALGHYALACAERGCIALVWSSAPPTIHAIGGRGRVIGNGPTAYGVPVPDGPPIVFDAAMSVGSGGKVQQVRARGEALPEGWIVDSAGRPSTDPEQAAAGAFVPVGGHKGFGLALLAEVLGSALPGAPASSELPPMFPPPDRPFGLGHTILALDPAVFGSGTGFLDRIGALGEHVRASSIDPEHAPVRLPGEGAARREREAAEQGLAVDARLWATLTGLRVDAAP